MTAAGLRGAAPQLPRASDRQPAFRPTFRGARGFLVILSS